MADIYLAKNNETKNSCSRLKVCGLKKDMLNRSLFGI